MTDASTQRTQKVVDRDGPDPERVIEPAVHSETPEAVIAEAEGTSTQRRDDDVPRNTRATIGVDRAAIGKKFAAKRAEQSDIAYTGDFAQLRAGRLTQEVPDDPEPEAPQTADTTTEARESGSSDSQAAPTRKIKVRGEERELNEEELITAAQIGLAGQSYLDEAKRKLDQVEERLRAVPEPQHPGAKTPASTTGDTTAATTDSQHPENDLSATIEKIQYGAPDEAAEAFQAAIDNAVKKATDPNAVRKAIYMDHRDKDVARSVAIFKDFAAKKENAELLKDANNEAVMQNIYYGQVRADLEKIGLAQDQIPADRMQMVELHRFHRLHGQPIRDTSTLLDASKQAFTEWKGGPKPQDPEPTAGERAGVRVNVDRTQRRLAIPQQPSRAAVPQPREPARRVPTSKSAAAAKILANRRRNVAG